MPVISSHNEHWCGFALVVTCLLASVPAFAQAPDGAALFTKSCTVCHTSAIDTRAPSVDALRPLSSDVIVYALTGGSMRYQGLSLSGADRIALAEYLSGRKPETAATAAAMPTCPANGRFSPTPDSWNGWGPTVENTHFQSTKKAGLRVEQI